MSDCIIWTGSLDKDGYGRATKDGKKWRAHRLAFVEAGGELVDSLVIDHLCNVRACVNPEHLRQCTHRENVMAEHSMSVSRLNALKSHCKNGHPYDEENTRYAGGKRHCRACVRAASARYAANLADKS